MEWREVGIGGGAPCVLVERTGGLEDAGSIVGTMVFIRCIAVSVGGRGLD